VSRTKIIVVVAILLLAVANVVTPFRVQRLAITLKPEQLGHLGPVPLTNTLVAGWLAALALIIVAFACKRSLVAAPKPLSVQNIVEAICEVLLGYMQRFAGANAIRFFPVAASLFAYILVANWMALAPGIGSIGLRLSSAGGEMVPLVRSLATDLNATLALAIWSVCSVQYFGMRMSGTLAHLARYIAIGRLVEFGQQLVKGQHPRITLLLRGLLDLFIGLLETFEELTKILSFSFRLFGNVFGGEVLLTVIAFLMPYLASVPFLALELFTGLIQAFIFAVLSTAFFARAVAPHNDSAAVPA